MKVKFISLNLWQGGNLFENVISFFKSENPDILILQEVYNGKNPIFDRKYRSLDELQKELNFPYFSFSPAFLEIKSFGKIDQGNAIFSKFPIISTRTIFYDIPYNKRHEECLNDYPFNPRNLQHVMIKINSQTINVFNTQGIWGLDGKDNKRRLEMSKTIVNEIKNKKNVILAGDFNLRPETKTIQKIEKYLSNVFKNELKTSFNIKRKEKDKKGYSESVVDMFFVSNNTRIVEHRCPEVDVSDHLPLVCELEF